MDIYLGTIFNIKKNISDAYSTQVRIEDSNLGILLPETFMPIAEKTVQCKEIFKWTYNECYKVIDRLNKRNVHFRYLIICCSVKVLSDDELIDNFINKTSEFNRFDFEFSKFAFSISPDVLFCKEKSVIKNIEKLRKKGSKIILNNFGCEGFPTSEIISAPIDIVILDEFLTKCIYGDEKQQLYARGISEMLLNLKKDILINNIKNEKEFNLVKSYCTLASGKYFGKYKKDRYVR